MRIIKAGLCSLVIMTCLGEVRWAHSESPHEFSQNCPKNLSELEEKMENLLTRIINDRFKKTMRSSIHASIPQAIQQADGIIQQMASLRKQIREQHRSQARAEYVARKAVGNLDRDLIACKPGEEGRYCDAVEQFYIGKASILANQSFLNALACYQAQGVL